MSNAIGSSSESNPSRRICHLRAVPLGHVADSEMSFLTPLSIGADDVSFHSTVRKPTANVGNTSGSWFLFI